MAEAYTEVSFTNQDISNVLCVCVPLCVCNLLNAIIRQFNLRDETF